MFQEGFLPFYIDRLIVVKGRIAEDGNGVIWVKVEFGGEVWKF